MYSDKMMFSVKVHKMGNNIGIYLKKSIRKKLRFNKGDCIKITIIGLKKPIKFLTRFNYNIVLRKAIIRGFKLKHGDILKVKIERVVDAVRPKEIFKENKIDLLSLIPEKTFLGYRIFVDVFKNKDEEWLRIWYSHTCGSGRQLEIKRYVNARSFGSLLGQIQAEGSKCMKYLVFSNQLITEHKDFISFLSEMGILKKLFNVDLYFNPQIYNAKLVQSFVNEFEEATKIKVII